MEIKLFEKTADIPLNNIPVHFISTILYLSEVYLFGVQNIDPHASIPLCFSERRRTSFFDQRKSLANWFPKVVFKLLSASCKVDPDDNDPAWKAVKRILVFIISSPMWQRYALYLINQIPIVKYWCAHYTHNEHQRISKTLHRHRYMTALATKQWKSSWKRFEELLNISHKYKDIMKEVSTNYYESHNLLFQSFCKQISLTF